MLTDWPVTTEAEALRLLRFYPRRWAVEDTFKFIKTCFGVEAVQLLRLAAIRRLVAFAWVAAGFFFH
ncbi:MAG: transposase [Aggregatilineales bacterium]